MHCFKIIDNQNDNWCTKRRLNLRKRVALTPESAKNIIGLGLKVCIEKNLANHIGISDKEYEAVGTEVKKFSRGGFSFI